jgi:hypothetical protein
LRQKEKAVEPIYFFRNRVQSLRNTGILLFQESSQIEANKFFNYYSTCSWLIGKKNEDWKQQQGNWMLNTAKFATNTSKEIRLQRPTKTDALAHNSRKL